MIPLQPMARTKQTARKMTADGTLPVTTTGNTGSTPTPLLQIAWRAETWRLFPGGRQDF